MADRLSWTFAVVSTGCLSRDMTGEWGAQCGGSAMEGRSAAMLTALSGRAQPYRSGAKEQVAGSYGTEAGQRAVCRSAAHETQARDCGR
jgi:type IV secretory pathway TrbL component